MMEMSERIEKKLLEVSEKLDKLSMHEHLALRTTRRHSQDADISNTSETDQAQEKSSNSSIHWEACSSFSVVTDVSSRTMDVNTPIAAPQPLLEVEAIPGTCSAG
ncbi:hypothetical protein FRC03_010497 [Tulasnella sp. 419]|nr:hypothetical protein FRC02_008345 [Tulasnella sp. 418]KAG8957145.1 hypothetical protein FRC03_010497 [Tulasnella sp. 419]